MANNGDLREALETPFPAELIRSRPGKHGEQLRYVPTHSFIERMNSVYAGEWDFRIVNFEIREDEVVVIARLTAGEITKEDFGSAAVIRKKDNGEVVGIGDSFKSAASDALKRCCRLLGLGLSLWTDDPDGIQPTKNQDRGNGRSERKDQGTPSNGNGRLTTKQHQFIKSLAKEKEIGDEDLDQMALDRFSKSLAFISKADASSLIQELQES